jgi:peptide/nickel transport system substrate-binding protein
MTRSAYRLLAASSLLLATLAVAQSRPQYGGTLHIASRVAPASLDPAEIAPTESLARASLTALMFDNLVAAGNFGNIQPALATSWQSDPGNQRWQFWLRRGVKFHDGSALTSDAVASSLRFANPGWNVFANGDSVTVETTLPMPYLLAELALPRNAIAKRNPGATISGTGPFHVTDWQPGKRLTLAVQEDYWNGRPFLDGMVIDLGKGSRDQLISLDLGKTDLVELTPEQVHRAAAEGRRVLRSQPVVLIALVFNKDRVGPEDGRFRDALSLSVDRNSMRNVLLQGQGEPASGILPNWLTGYEFVFPSEFNRLKAQQLTSVLRPSPWTLAYDSTDPLARLIADRIVLNARDAGISIQTTASTSADIRLVNVTLPSLSPQLALTSFAITFGLPQPKFTSSSIEDLFQAESALLQSQRVIPLLRYPLNYAVSPAVRGYTLERSGLWQASDVWLAAKP